MIQFSLRITLTCFTLLAAFFTLVRGSDLASAVLCMLCFGGLLSPLIATFAFLHFQRVRGGQGSARPRSR